MHMRLGLFLVDQLKSNRLLRAAGFGLCHAERKALVVQQLANDWHQV